jgi:hypothetical protein
MSLSYIDTLFAAGHVWTMYGGSIIYIIVDKLIYILVSLWILNCLIHIQHPLAPVGSMFCMWGVRKQGCCWTGGVKLLQHNFLMAFPSETAHDGKHWTTGLCTTICIKHKAGQTTNEILAIGNRPVRLWDGTTVMVAWTQIFPMPHRLSSYWPSRTRLNRNGQLGGPSPLSAKHQDKQQSS